MGQRQSAYARDLEVPEGWRMASPRNPGSVARVVLCAALATAPGCSSEAPPARVDTGRLPTFQRLTYTAESETAPAFSPDGRRLAYERNGGIWIMEISPRSASRASVRGNHPSWSPDGTALWFARRDFEGAGLIHRLIHLEVASGDVDTVSADTIDVYEPTAAPEGSAIALRMLSRVNRLQTLRTVTGEGAALATLTGAGSWVDTSPAWSRDMAWIAFVRVDAAGASRLMRVPAAGDVPASFVAGDTNGASGPSWHADGRIVFAKAGVISSVAAAGGTVSPYLLGAGFELEPTISPDGRSLVFTTDRTGNNELWILVDPAGLGAGPYNY